MASTEKENIIMSSTINVTDHTAEPVTFRWTGKEGVITDPTSELVITVKGAQELLALLDAHRVELMSM
jgi:hypothetical protein